MASIDPFGTCMEVITWQKRKNAFVGFAKIGGLI